MSTPAAILIPGIKAAVYKHSDGDPLSTLKWLEDFNKKFAEARGKDCSYKLAALLRSSASDAAKYNLDDSLYTGWGIMVGWNGDGTDFIYTLHADGKVTWVKG